MDDGAKDVLDAIDVIDAHMLPFFSSKASTGMNFKMLISQIQSLIYYTASKAWPLVQADLTWWIANGEKKKIYLTEVRYLLLGVIPRWYLCTTLQNGWPSVSYSGVEPNSAAAVANVQNEHVSTMSFSWPRNLSILQDYFALLDSKCSYFKTLPGGGLGWFAHIYSDDQEPGYGIYDTNGDLKFKFAPKTTCWSCTMTITDIPWYWAVTVILCTYSLYVFIVVFVCSGTNMICGIQSIEFRVTLSSNVLTL